MYLSIYLSLSLSLSLYIYVYIPLYVHRLYGVILHNTRLFYIMPECVISNQISSCHILSSCRAVWHYVELYSDLDENEYDIVIHTDMINAPQFRMFLYSILLVKWILVVYIILSHSIA